MPAPVYIQKRIGLFPLRGARDAFICGMSSRGELRAMRYRSAGGCVQNRTCREAIRQCADAVDFDLDGGAVLDRADTERRAACDHISRTKGHVAREEAHLLVGRKDHVGERVVLTFDAVYTCYRVGASPVELRRDRRADTAECVAAFR